MEYNENTYIHPENTHLQPDIQRKYDYSTQETIEHSLLLCSGKFGIDRTNSHKEIKNYFEIKKLQNEIDKQCESLLDMKRRRRRNRRDNRQDSEQTPNILSGIKPETIEMGLNLFAQLIEKTLNKNTTI